jgi:predicted nucleotidyltransferase
MNDQFAIQSDRIVAAILEFYPQTEAVYVFGSFASGVQDMESDLDLAILLPVELAKRAELSFLSPLHDRLGELTGLPVDCINMRQASTVFQREIINQGMRIFCHIPEQCTNYEALVVSLYQKLNEERDDIIRDIYATGRVLAS